jgi:deoxyguanosine kinase
MDGSCSWAREDGARQEKAVSCDGVFYAVFEARNLAVAARERHGRRIVMALALPFRYVAIDGAIGVGKTTLVHLLCERFAGEALLEDAENPFLNDFYLDTANNALPTELYFMVSRFRQLQEATKRSAPARLAISDYAFQRNEIFAHLTLSGDELALFDRMYRQLEPQLPPPDLVLYLVADTDTCMGRINRRRRGYESTLSRDYLDTVVAAYDRYYQRYDRTPLLVIDTRNLNFPAAPQAFELLVERLLAGVEGAEFFPGDIPLHLMGSGWQNQEAQLKGDEDVGH